MGSSGFLTAGRGETRGQRGEGYLGGLAEADVLIDILKRHGVGAVAVFVDVGYPCLVVLGEVVFGQLALDNHVALLLRGEAVGYAAVVGAEGYAESVGHLEGHLVAVVLNGALAIEGGGYLLIDGGSGFLL